MIQPPKPGKPPKVPKVPSKPPAPTAVQRLAAQIRADGDSEKFRQRTAEAMRGGRRKR